MDVVWSVISDRWEQFALMGEYLSKTVDQPMRDGRAIDQDVLAIIKGDGLLEYVRQSSSLQRLTSIDHNGEGEGIHDESSHPEDDDDDLEADEGIAAEELRRRASDIEESD